MTTLSTAEAGYPLPTATHHVALRMDDVGAATKQNEQHGRTRIRAGSLNLPFPGNFLGLKRLPGVRRWGPYREMTAAEWLDIVTLLDEYDAYLTVAITASWVESPERLTPFPEKFPDEAAAILLGVRKGRIEVANHGLTHCMLKDGAYKPRAFSSNRRFHREFRPELPPEEHEVHLREAQRILESYFGTRVTTLVPPGNLFTNATAEAALSCGLELINCNVEGSPGSKPPILSNRHVLAFHDREIVLEGVAWLERHLARLRDRGLKLAFVKDIRSY